MTPETIAQAVWENATRTLASGTPDPPSNLAEEYAEAVWEYMTRTLTGGGGGAVAGRARLLLGVG